MKLTVLSLKGVEFEGEVTAFNTKTLSGEITILDNHRPLITVLKKGTASITRANGDKINMEINAGFLEMNQNNELNVLIDPVRGRRYAVETATVAPGQLTSNGVD